MDDTRTHRIADHVEEHVRALLHALPGGATTEQLRAHADLTQASREAMRLLSLLPSGQRWTSWHGVARALERLAA